MEYKFKNGSFLKVIESKGVKRSSRADEWMKYSVINLDKEEMEAVTKVILSLEYLGIHIENQKLIGAKQICYFSVPESSLIKSSSENYANKLHTSEGLMKLAKEILSELYMIIALKDTDEDDPFDKEFINEMKEHLADYFAFYGKVRTGQVWNEELGKKAVEDAAKTDYVQVK